MTKLTGFVNIIKPTGCSSSDVVIKVKKILKTKKVGHLGTLDPAASGVLPISIGKATKFFDYFLKKDKEYVALVQFGYETDSQDSFGEIIKTDSKIIETEMINEVLNEFVGEIDQIPPKYSAIKINGKRACDLARENADFEIKSRKISIYSIKLLQKCEKNQFLFKVHCSAGTYIRTLFYDIAKRLGTVAITPVIIRTKSGLFNTQNSITLEELENTGKILSIEDVFNETKKIIVNKDIAFKLINGVKLDISGIGLFPLGEDFFIYYEEKIIGLYFIEENILKPKVFLYESN
ncbi:MAG: tRNA pseudouridine(55) synthase TruB [Clostridia bacterium]|nr:tRNA pseudouridine(55) synthase TruB [Clostridia bacterium]